MIMPITVIAEMSRSTSAPAFILDGGMSRELIRLGAPFRQPEWSALALIEAPAFVSQVHESFLSAGADVVTTNSYAIVPFHLGKERFWKQGAELAALAGRLAREAADSEAATTGRQILVAGSLPPIFGSYEPMNFDPERVHDYLKILVQALDPYVDVWLAETLSILAEAKAAYTSVASTGKPLWVAFSPDDSPSADKITPRLRSGETIEEAANWALTTNLKALLFNCARPEYMNDVLAIARSVFVARFKSETPMLGVYANTFVPASTEHAANEVVSPTDDKLSAEVYADFASQWAANGVDIVGGCCGIGHGHIRRLTELFRPSSKHIESTAVT